MSRLDINFEWFRDRAGYELRDECAVDSKDYLLGVYELPLRIVRQGGALAPYQPLARFEGLYVQYIRVTAPADLLNFVRRFGPLTERALEKDGFDDVKLLLRHAAAMRRFSETGDGIVAGKVGLSEPLGRLDFKLVFDPARQGLAFEYGPRSLLTALWLQFAQDLGSGVALRNCPHCGQPFKAGPGGRRSDARFCSTEHQMAFKSLQRSRKGSATNA